MADIAFIGLELDVSALKSRGDIADATLAKLQKGSKLTTAEVKQLNEALGLVGKTGAGAAVVGVKSLDTEMRRTQTAARQTTQVFNTLRGGMTSMALAATGTVAPGLTTVVSALGNFALGSPLMVGVLAGVTAVAGVWTLVTREAREAEKAQKEASKAAQDAGRAILTDPVFEANKRLLELREKSLEVDKEIAALRAGRPAAGLTGAQAASLQTAPSGGGDPELVRQQRLNELIQQNRDLGFEVAQQQKIIADDRAKDLDNEGKRLAELIRLEKERLRLQKERHDAMIENMIANRPQGATAGEIQAFRNRTRGLREPALINDLAEARAERIQRELRDQREALRELERVAEGMASSVTNAFEAWVTGAHNAADAFRDMVSSILLDLARLVAQKGIVEPLAGLFLQGLQGLNIPGSGGTTTTGGGSIRSTSASFSVAPPAPVIVNQTNNFTLASLDPRTHADLLREQAGTIADITIGNARRSSSFRNALAGG